MKSTLLLNAAWLAVAVGAFWGGREWAKRSASAPVTASTTGAPGLLGGQAAAPGAILTRVLIPGLADHEIPRWVTQKESLSPDDMTKAMASVMTESDPVKRSLLFSQLLSKLTPENAKAAWDSVNKGAVGFERMQTAGLFLYAWGTVDGESAVKAANENAGIGGGFMKTISLSGWAAKDPDKAIAWLNQQKEGNDRNTLQRGLVSGMARADSKRATDYVLGLTDENSKRGLIGAIAEEVMKKGFGAAEDWARGLPSDDLKGDALSTLARDYVRQDPESAKKWAVGQADKSYARDAVGQVTEDMVRRQLNGETKDIQSSLSWVNDLPAGQGRQEAFRQTFQEWSRTDPEAAATYLGKMGASADKDYAVSAFAQQVAQDDAHGATVWASTIQDEKLRMESLQRGFSKWAQEDQAAAQAWAAKQGYSPEVVQKISEPPPQARRDRAQAFGLGGFGGGGRIR